MKQNYIFCLVGVLSIYSLIFSMDESEIIKKFNELYTNAVKLEEDIEWEDNSEIASKKEKEALISYAKAVEIVIPQAKPNWTGKIWTDPYAKERKDQQQARQKVLDGAEKLISAKKYNEALELYNYASISFAKEIIKLKNKIQDERTAIKSKLNSIQLLANQHKYEEAIQILRDLENDPLSSDVIKKEVTQFMAKILEEKEKWGKKPPTSFITDLQNLKNKFNQLAHRVKT